jgi:hypothetical protein
MGIFTMAAMNTEFPGFPAAGKPRRAPVSACMGNCSEKSPGLNASKDVEKATKFAKNQTYVGNHSS